MKKVINAAILAFAALVAMVVLDVSAPAKAQTPGKISITGRVKMGTPGLSLPVTTSLILHAHDGHDMALMLNGEADAQGAFRFENLESKQGRIFDVMAALGPTVYYAETITPQPGQSDYEAAITIYGTTKDTGGLQVDRLHNFVEFINRQQVRTTEIYVLSNTGDRTIEGGETTADGKPATLRFSLPAGAEGVRFDGGAVGARFFRTSDGFLDAQGVPPGERSSQVMVSYVLPYAGQVHLEHRVNYLVQGTDVILPAGAGIELAGQGLEAQGTQQAPNGTSMKVYSGPKLVAGTRLAYDLTGQLSAAQASLLDGGADQESTTQPPKGFPASLARTIRATVGGSPLSAALAGLGLLLAALALFWWLRLHSDRTAEAEVSQPEADRDALIQAIADLDDARAAGQVDAEDYQVRRRRLLDTLLAVVEADQEYAALASK